MVNLADIERARDRIRAAVPSSPCPFSETISTRVGFKCWLKLENLQVTGSFKERGACNKLLTLTTAERARGIVCASAGNHAQGVAHHAARLQIDSVIVMPEPTPLVKVQSTTEFLRGTGRILMCGANYDEAFEEAVRIASVENRVLVHPFDDDEIIAGQGTIGLELLESQIPLDAVIVPVGGGGVIAGIAIAIKETRPDIRVIGVQTTAIPSMREALRVGSSVTVPAVRTLAEGIAVRRAGERPLEAIRRYVDDIVLVDDEEIAQAILILLEKEKTVAEGAGAASLAAALGRHSLGLTHKNVALLVSGGNIDVNVVSRIIERGLVKSGRLVRLEVRIPDVTGALARLTAVIAARRGNVVEIHHDRAFSGTGLSEVKVELVLETRGDDHVQSLVSALQHAGYKATRC